MPNQNGSGNGDGNGDGVLDSAQPNVSSFRNGADGGYLTLAVANGLNLADVTRSPAPATVPAGVHLPQGLLGFSIQGVPVGGQISLQLTIHSGDSPIGYWKFGPTSDNPTPHWYPFAFDGNTGAIVLDNRTVQLQLVDGGRGDSDLTANGVIVDPGGPGGRVRFDIWLPRISKIRGRTDTSTGEVAEAVEPELWLPVINSTQVLPGQ